MKKFYKNVLIFLGIMILMITQLVGCSSGEVLNIDEFTIVCFTGYNSYGEVSIKVNQSIITETYSNGTLNGEIATINFAESINYTYDKSENLKNGDKIKVTATYSEKIAETLKVNVKKAEFTVEVKGLEEKPELIKIKISDVYDVTFGKNLYKGEISFKKNIQDIKLSISCDEFPEARFHESFGNGNIICEIYNGLKITLRAEYDNEKLWELGYAMETDTEEFIVNGTSFILIDDIVIDAMIFQDTLSLVNLSISEFTDKEVDDLLALQGATIIDLNSNQISDLNAIQIEKLAKREEIIELRLQGNPISDVSTLGALTNLTSLSLESEQTISDISALKNLTNLKRLRFAPGQITDEQLKELENALPNCWTTVYG